MGSGEMSGWQNTRIVLRTLSFQTSRPSSLKISDSNIESDETEEENRSFGCQDVKQFCPTCIILLITVVIMVTVIPYAFSNVIKQMQAADAVAEWREKMEKMNQTTE